LLTLEASDRSKYVNVSIDEPDYYKAFRDMIAAKVYADEEEEEEEEGREMQLEVKVEAEVKGEREGKGEGKGEQ